MPGPGSNYYGSNFDPTAAEWAGYGPFSGQGFAPPGMSPGPINGPYDSIYTGSPYNTQFGGVGNNQIGSTSNGGPSLPNTSGNGIVSRIVKILTGGGGNGGANVSGFPIDLSSGGGGSFNIADGTSTGTGPTIPQDTSGSDILQAIIDGLSSTDPNQGAIDPTDPANTTSGKSPNPNVLKPTLKAPTSPLIKLIQQVLGGGNGNAGILSSLLGLGTGALSGLQNAHGLAWGRNALDTVYGNMNTAAGRGQKGFNTVADQLTPGSQGMMGLGQNLAGTTSQLSPQMQALQAAIPGLMTRSAMTPQMQQILQSMGGSLDNVNTPLQAGGSVLNSGGATPLTNTAAQGAGNIIGNQGNTPGSNLLNSFGKAALTSGGATPLSNYLGSRGVDLTQTNPVFSPLIAASMSKDLAGSEYRKAQEQAQAQALLRGGGPGSVVATGQANKGMADFSDAASANDAQQFANSLLNQQGLGLQQFSQGSGMAQGAAGLNLQGQGLGSSAVQGGQGMANQQLLAALGLLPTTQNAQTNLFGTGGGIYGNAMNTQLGGLNSIFGNTMGAQGLGLQQGQGISNSMSNLFGEQMGLGSLGNSLFNSGSNNLQSILNGYNSSGNTALNNENTFGGIGGLQGILGSAWTPFLDNAGKVLSQAGTNIGGAGTRPGTAKP